MKVPKIWALIFLINVFPDQIRSRSAKNRFKLVSDLEWTATRRRQGPTSSGTPRRRRRWSFDADAKPQTTPETSPGRVSTDTAATSCSGPKTSNRRRFRSCPSRRPTSSWERTGETFQEMTGGGGLVKIISKKYHLLLNSILRRNYFWK